MTPLTTVSASADAYLAHDVINSDIGKTLSSDCEVTVDTAGHTTVGYASSTVAYLEAVDDAKTQLGADNTAYDFVYIKHTGYRYGDATTLNVNATTDALKILVETTAGSAWTHIASLPPGGSIVLPNFPAQGANLGLFVETSGASHHIAVEYALIT
jgi:hypothetical protein